ncbi:sigma-54-dependent transcriptional regulator [Deferrisoma palaeochoriense]
MEPNRLLLVDDDRVLARTLARSLALAGYEVETASTAEAARRAFHADPEALDLALLDLRLPDGDGLELLEEFRQARPDLPCLVLTAYGSVQTAVEAMRRGAVDFLMKPFPREKLLASVERALERRRLLDENERLRRQLRQTRKSGTIATQSPAFAAVLEMVRRAAPTDATVLITGETGVGKERLAALVHEWSRRRDAPFLTVNCAALAESLLDSQLFGHVRGAFTGADEDRRGLFEEADGGTLFLDEVGDVSPALQAKLLRVLQEGECLPVGATRPRKVDVRIVAATNRDLATDVRAGRFREDLYYRLHVFTVRVPPLRERLEDLPALVQAFVEEANRKTGRAVRGLSAAALEACRAYPWPGNVRELKNVVERAVILCPGEWIGPDLLALGEAAGPTAEGEIRWPGRNLTLREVEAAYIAEVLRRTRWGKSAAARILGISRKTLDRKIREYGLTPGEGPA